MVHLVIDGLGHHHNPLRKRHEYARRYLFVTLHPRYYIYYSFHAMMLIQPSLGIIAFAFKILLHLGSNHLFNAYVRVLHVLPDIMYTTVPRLLKISVQLILKLLRRN